MAGLIPKHFIDRVLANADIVEVINARVPLKKQGKEFSACCPFHNEKSPSFTVSPNKQFYHCFGCGAHGSAISFLMEYERLDFVEAIEALAESQGLEVEREDSGAPQKQTEDTTSIFNAVEAASNYFHSQLKTSPRAIDYFKGRQINGATAKNFQLGYAPDGWHNLLSALEKTYNHQTLLKAGLLSKNDSGKLYDKFRDRVMFPIRDPRGRTIAFGGRVLDKGEPKYLNSPETPIFHKSQVLYGLYEARQHSRKLEHFYVVEGYMDVIAMAQHDIHNAVATLGTATTPEHLTKLFRQVSQIVFCFDGDKAGKKAAWRALTIALPIIRDGKRIDFIFLPDGEDPDTFLKKEGIEGFNFLHKNATPLSAFLLQHLSENYDTESMEGRSELGIASQNLLQNMHEGLLKTQLIGAIADLSKLGNTTLKKGIPVLDNSRPLLKKPINRQQKIEVTPMRVAISALLQHPNLATGVSSELINKSSPLPGGALFTQLYKLITTEPEMHTAMLLERFRDNPHLPQLETLSVWQPPLVEESSWESLLKDALKTLDKHSKEHKLTELLNKSELNSDEKSELAQLLIRPNSH